MTRGNDNATWLPDVSVAGFHEVPCGGRVTENFNAGWRFNKGAMSGAEANGYDDSAWPVVKLPHGLEILPLEASGGINYQGEAWYRKRFHIPAEFAGRRVVLNFEGVMGKSRFWVNGRLTKSHFGGYLPCVLDVSEAVSYGRENVIAVLVDNSDDPTYPPGKPQSQLDYSYFGGIYRDVWMIVTNRVHITDANEVDKVAGGGVFVHFEEVSEQRAIVCIDTHVANTTSDSKALTVEAVLSDQSGQQKASHREGLILEGGADSTLRQKVEVDAPHLWHVDDPYLHHLTLRVSGQDGNVLDAVRLKIGIRSIAFKGKDGFFLNGKPFDGKLIGTNRHQDYAYVGNAVSNHAHWRDAVLLRQAGMRVIRCAHYPQDPAFMDACDELGMFVIITTPGWQFWSADPVFEQRVYSDIRNMVRRDRNRPSAWLWEPILNETNYPDYFAKRVHELTHEEYPFSGCYTACDLHAAGQEHFDVAYSHVIDWQEGLIENTPENMERLRFDYRSEARCVFTREWGDCVDNWRSQSSPSRVNKAWGEQAQLVQAQHYADPAGYCYTCYESLCSAPRQHVGGTLWHGVDHQRGYHADPFWGGMLDATRQPKYAYHMFRAQVPPDARIPHVETGPFVIIAHILHPTSGSDITVFSNCDHVRLSYGGELIGTLPTQPEGTHMPRRPVVFKGVYKHIRQAKVLEAEGLIGGQVVATAVRRPWDRRQRLQLKVDLHGVPLVADGSDFVPVVAQIVDKYGEVVRLTEDSIRFAVEGPAEQIGGDEAGINPQPLRWGEAVILVRAGLEPGRITVRAECARPSVCRPLAVDVVIESSPAARAMAFVEQPCRGQAGVTRNESGMTVEQLRQQVRKLAFELNEIKLREVEQQQDDFA